MSISEYMQKIKLIGDALQAIGETKMDHNLVKTVLLGLSEENRGFVGALNTHRTRPTFEELHATFNARRNRSSTSCQLDNTICYSHH